jgi:hypothetical protein
VGDGGPAAPAAPDADGDDGEGGEGGVLVVVDAELLAGAVGELDRVTGAEVRGATLEVGAAVEDRAGFDDDFDARSDDAPPVRVVSTCAACEALRCEWDGAGVEASPVRTVVGGESAGLSEEPPSSRKPAPASTAAKARAASTSAAVRRPRRGLPSSYSGASSG